MASLCPPANAFGSPGAPDPAVALAQRCSALWDEFGRVTSLEPMPSANATDGEREAKWRWEDEQQAVSEEWSDTFDRMTVTPPTTSQGAAAMIRSYLKCEGEMISEEHRCIELLESLLSYLDTAHSRQRPEEFPQSCRNRLQGCSRCKEAL